jgi:SAM-dependent methyltransferase
VSPFRQTLAMVFRGQRSFVVGGVRYRERTSEPLHRALSERGPGFKDYDALFSGAAPLRIRCTALRQYADIAGQRVLAPYELADPILRPGMRVLDIRCSTGFGAAHLAQRVGPSGAVVAIDTDHESIRYARRRYDTANISFELGGIDSVGGELDGAFDAVVAVNLLRVAEEAPSLVVALWRVLAPGGPMLLVQPLPGDRAGAQPGPVDGPDPESTLRLTAAELRYQLRDLEPAPGIEPAETTELAAIIARKPQNPAEPAARERPGPYPPMR